MNRDISLFAKDILESIEKAEEFVRSMSYESFVEDDRTIYAVIKCIEIIGEAAKHIPKPIRNKFRTIPWKDMSGMRDKVVHLYFGVKLDMVWLAVKEELPEIKNDIKHLLEFLLKSSELL
ncbi:MAG: DUF86 domain-containing protein [Nitrospirae bacterium]|nr:DUF86 domain-containing protein [Nitrospirota bacterium]MBF0535704.1 DUF86 domain-containing protein [Nitrospirota bacterium]MBF0617529.1 DUF86 domain-containing protein [Nitrospirota bacterium]